MTTSSSQGHENLIKLIKPYISHMLSDGTRIYDKHVIR